MCEFHHWVVLFLFAFFVAGKYGGKLNYQQTIESSVPPDSTQRRQRPRLQLHLLKLAQEGVLRQSDWNSEAEPPHQKRWIPTSTPKISYLLEGERLPDNQIHVLGSVQMSNLPVMPRAITSARVHKTAGIRNASSMMMIRAIFKRWRCWGAIPRTRYVAWI